MVKKLKRSKSKSAAKKSTKVTVKFVLLAISLLIFLGLATYTMLVQKANILVVNNTAPYKIGAYYFPMWNPVDIRNEPSLNSIGYKGCQQTYGRSGDPWCGVRDFFEGKTQGWKGDFSHLKPAIGYYDDTKPETYEKHIMQARQNGLSFFSFYYYWDDKNKKELLETSMNAFLKARNNADIEFMLSAFFFPTAENSYPKVVDNIVSKYFKQPNYLKTADGRPIFTLGDARQLTNAKSFITQLNTRSLEVLGKTPYLVGMSTGIPTDLTVDGYTCLNRYVDTRYQPGAMQGGYERYLAVIPGTHNAGNKPYLTCVLQAFDERPRTGVVPWIPRDQIRTVVRTTPELFKQVLQKEKAFMDSRTDPLSKIMVVYAWNEWHEGGILEPTEKFGSNYLKMIPEVFGLPRGNDSCRDTGQCVYTPPQKIIVPEGNLDSATCETITGWAWQPGHANKPLEVHLYYDGAYPQGKYFYAIVSAALPRQDIRGKTGDNGQHGFSVKTPQFLKDGKEHTIYAHGINATDRVTNPLLANSGIKIKCNP